MKRKLTVITDEHGHVVATQIGHGEVPHPESGVVAKIIAGPGQYAHKIEYDVPQQMHSRREIELFHQNLAKHLTNGQK